MSQHLGVKIVRLPTIRSKHLDTLVHTFFSTIHACVSDYDVVHFHTLGPSLFSWLPRMFGKKTVVSVQGLDWQRKKWSWFARQVLRVGEWASARLPHKTIVVSKTLRSYYIARYRPEPTYLPPTCARSSETFQPVQTHSRPPCCMEHEDHPSPPTLSGNFGP